MQETLARFNHAFHPSDIASAAKFNVLITAPPDFANTQGESLMEHFFITTTESKGLTFQAYNSGEVDVICTPRITADIQYHVFFNETSTTEFTIKAKETVSFHVFILPNGLSEKVTEADLLIDIRQLQEGGSI